MRRKLLVLLAVLATAIATALPVVAQDDAKGDPAPEVAVSEYDSYIVVLKADPLVANFSQRSLQSSAALREAEKISNSHESLLRGEGVSINGIVNTYTNALNGFSVRMTHKEAMRVAANPAVQYVLADELRQPTTDSSPKFLRLTKKNGAWTAGYTGAGVVVGVIDTGIWPEHASFADNGMPAPPITLDDSVRPDCEFGNTAHNPDDAPFECNNKLIGARQMLDTYRALIGAETHEFDSARDDDGHGTHTASTAAGNADVDAEIFGIDYGTVSGIAPNAHVVAYKGLGELGGFTSDLTAAIDQAVADGVDVINYSIGGGGGSIGADDVAFLFANDAGVFVATSAGNNGPGPATVGSPGETPWITTVGANSQERFWNGVVKVRVAASYGYDELRIEGAMITEGTKWAPFVDAADISNNGNDQCLPGELDPGSADGAIVLCRRGASARAAKSVTVLGAGGAGMVMYNNVDADNLFTDSHVAPTVHINNTDGVGLKAVISGADAQAKLVNDGKKKVDSAPSTTYFSSRGPNTLSPDIIKPDVTAPGHQIVAGASPIHSNDDAQGQLFQSISGTSMSSPHVAGLYALMKEAHPDWTASMAKSALMTSASTNVRKEDRSSKADPFDIGAGHVRPLVKKGGAFNPGLVYDISWNEYLAYSCDDGIGLVSQDTCDALEGLGFSLDASDLNLASIGIAGVPGQQTITRTVTSVADKTYTFKAKVKAPAGFDVKVTPKKLTLAPGESASFTVTFNNESAPLGEWRFGKLKWKTKLDDSGKRYKVKSPIAVAASAFNAPSGVVGSGTDGSTSFEVLFGYTGDYSAAAHGLVGDTGESGSVAQDPDQTWPSADDGAGVTEHDFSLSGSAFMRITLDESDLIVGDPANTDIDLFLYKDGDPTNVVAASTAGGTHEEITLVFPEDGDYTLVVHGWAIAPDTDTADYTFHMWDISATPGGSLAIDDAPTSATLGETGVIDVSWSGLSSGQTYMGAVSHSDGTDILGLTLVEVLTG